jgi:hypothetical protein
VPEDQELTDADWRTLCDTLRGSIAMFDMLLAECGNSSETARVVGDARRRREKVLEKIEGACNADRGGKLRFVSAEDWALVIKKRDRRNRHPARQRGDPRLGNEPSFVPPPLDRNDRSALPPAPTAPEPPFEVENHIGQSLDGRIATENGESRWITGEADLLHCHTHAGARRRGPCRCPHRGADDPQLTVRRCAGDNPFRVVIDPELSLTGRHGIFRDRAAPTLIVAAKEHGDRRGDAWELAWSRNGAICASANCRHA